MELVQVAVLIYKVGQEIVNVVETVNCNRKSCQTISKRVRALMSCVEDLSKRRIPASYEDTLNRLHLTFKEIAEFIKKFKKPTDGLIAVASWYAGLANSRSGDQSKLVSFNDALTERAQDLNLGITANASDDLCDLRDDLELMRQDLVEFREQCVAMDSVSAARVQSIIDEVVTTVSFSAAYIIIICLNI
jgi:hypothetical protein